MAISLCVLVAMRTRVLGVRHSLSYLHLMDASNKLKCQNNQGI